MLLKLLKTCQFWILVSGSPPGHIPEKTFKALDSMLQNSSRVLKKSAIDYYILAFIEHMLHVSDIVLVIVHVFYYLILTPWGKHVIVPIIQMRESWPLGKLHGPKLHY